MCVTLVIDYSAFENKVNRLHDQPRTELVYSFHMAIVILYQIYENLEAFSNSFHENEPVGSLTILI